MKKVKIEEAIKKKFPEPVSLVVCLDEGGMVDITPVGWFMMCNFTPKSWAISLNHSRYSHEVISQTNEFSLCLPTFVQKDDIIYCGTHSGRDVNKLENTSFETMPASKIKAPILKKCIAGYECKVVDKLKLSDHTIFIGKVLASYVTDEMEKIYSLGDLKFVKWILDK